MIQAICWTLVYEWRVSGWPGDKGGIMSRGIAGERLAGWIGLLGEYCSDHALLIVWVWLFVFTLRSLHMMGSLLYTQRIRHYGISAAPAGWQEKVDELSRQLGIRRAVKLVESRIVKMPLVTGHWRPMIFMPLGLLTGLPAGEIEAVLLHELAHIRRNDWLINLLQHIAVNLLFFNPGFLWMSALLREERENCCDDMAIDRTGDRAQFIRALINFKEHDLRMTKLANAFPAGKDQLLKRVRRIAHSTNKTLDPAEKIFLVISCILVSLLVIAMGAPSRKAKEQMGLLSKGRYTVVITTPAMVDEQEQEDIRDKLALDQRVRDRVQTERHKVQTDRSKVQADRKDRQTLLDKQQAERDAEQAIRDKKQAEEDMQQAARDKVQAEMDKQQAILDKLQAERDAHQAMLDKVQAGRDAVRAKPPIINLKK